MSTSTVNAGLDRAQYGRDWEEWHRAHEEHRADALGFLAITGLHWLTASPIDLPDAPGRWTTGAEGPVVELDDGEELLLDGETIRGRRALGPLAERGGLTLRFADGDVAGAIEVARRGGHDIVRPRRSDHPFLADYPGTPTYVPNPRWRVAARYIPFDEPQRTEVGSAVDGLQHVYEAPGRLEFELHGETFTLVAFPGKTPGSLSVLFTDATSGLTTYAANRSLSVPAPDETGATVVDFNRAVNLPCAYTDFATCPLPPAGNRLPVGIEAGEKTPLGRVHAADAPAAPA
ncbi:DUF1684 domain-containing protein [Microbacterium betulae]|uniref:DUF1684 domain-containing protein n=1 Tax=Microbacterium betulae TaxID=2981139 RepID=A0AA97I509_9MICO|nr:DUF1684 domain-containing protein [Microbacterium sp. AB]WOF23176.1 DUF1684 domain-containing protein [Microbacterium sp. AB]